MLPEELSQDKERFDRFEREARLLAQLNHSNIATLHGLEESDGQQFMIMELVEGETLAEYIARGSIPFDEALPSEVALETKKKARRERNYYRSELYGGGGRKGERVGRDRPAQTADIA